MEAKNNGQGSSKKVSKRTIKRKDKDEKRVLTGIKQLDDLEERIENVEQVLFHLRDIKMKQKLSLYIIAEAPVCLESDSSCDSTIYESSDSSSDELITFLAGKDLQWKFPKHTQEAEQKPFDVPIKSQEEDPLPLDIDFPYQEIASSSTG
nr:hypothetical protein [Tanacetum cinerariifolium]